MITDVQIQRINELAKKSKTTGLTPEETNEQYELRQLYIKQFRTNLKSTLDSIVIQNPDGSKEKLKHNPKPKRKN